MDDGLEPTQLFPTRNEVDAFNSNKLKQLTGAIHRFVAFDSGEEMFKKQLNNVCRLPEVLDLKIDSQVMLLKNLPNASNSGMVNGLLGRVIGFEKYDGSNGPEKNDSVDPTVLYPRVRFINKVVRTIVPEDITWENNGEILAKRIQVPLGLAWSMSIHKAQGLTLEKVKIDLGRIFEKGNINIKLLNFIINSNLRTSLCSS
jgi:ATP-dependent DNA helicase PIF1